MHRVCGAALTISVAAFATATRRCWCCRPTLTALVKGSRCARAHNSHSQSTHARGRAAARALTSLAIGVLYSLFKTSAAMVS
jgi:hypothetical protein